MLTPALASNVILTGGSCSFPGLVERLSQELRQALPDNLPLNITAVEQPATAAFRGGRVLARSPLYPQLVCTKAEYQEYGFDFCMSRFLS